MRNQCKIKSSLESADDGYDISLFPKPSKYPSIIMEFKWGSNLDNNTLYNLAKEAFSQINNKRYNSEMRELDVIDVLKLGIAFSEKKVKIMTE